MTEAEERPDLPKIIGTVGVKVPMLVVRLGVSYLRLKRSANRASRTFVAELESGGMPSDHARKLGQAYGSDISIRKFLNQTGAGGIQGVRLR